jgi:type III restriction enzyme
VIMEKVVIENPVINSPYEEPARHFKFTDEGITDEIVEARRTSAYFVPVPRPKKKGAQRAFETEWTQDRQEENKLINEIRARVALWRQGGYQGITKTTKKLLDYWKAADRDIPLFFCQIEAIETAIYLTEVADKFGDAWIREKIRAGNETSNPGLYRVAFKMATGSGKTVVMAMLIAWHTLNKLANGQDGRFTDKFLVVTPGITIRDRLRVLLPSDPENYYRKMDVVPPEDRDDIYRAKVIVTNFHSFLLRETMDAGKLTKKIVTRGRETAFTEERGKMVNRVCREFGRNTKNIVVINDEAHHCYRRKPDGLEEKLKGEERKEAKTRDEEARVWISGLEAIKKKIGIRVIYDLSATPFFLKGSGYSEGTLFPWVVSDFSLIDAIECGIVKVPRVPVADDAMVGEQPMYRNLWYRIREDLPKRGRTAEKVKNEPKLPQELEGALQSLYGNYVRYYEKWEAEAADIDASTPPVFIVVCNNTSVSKLVYDYVAGWEKELKGGETVLVPGKLELFSNVRDGNWLPRPNTILVDSRELESGEGMSATFKRIAKKEIDDFKSEYRLRFPGRDADALTDEDLLREVMNTVGKSGKLGEHIRCVVSVSMLTEGWDANTVTHILGIRAFGTQLLCEQVVGRALRRRSYETGDEGMFGPEYAEVYGVPFSFIPTVGSMGDMTPQRQPTRVRALSEREHLEITFPRLAGYRYELPSERLNARFTEDSRMVLSTADVPSKVENAPIVGKKSIHTLDDLKARRIQEVEFLIARLVLEKYFRDDEDAVKPWLFPQILAITGEWLSTCVECKDNMFPQILLLIEPAGAAADRIYRSIVAGDEGEKSLTPILRPYDTLGYTRYVDFDTVRTTWRTSETRCHVSHVVGDTDSWEQKMAQSLEEMDEVIRYVKNDHLGFKIPYTMNGEDHNYEPDFIVVLDDGQGSENPLNLIIEVTGERRPEKVIKVDTAVKLWVPAVNNHGGFGRWAFIEISDPWDAKNEIREFVL